MSDQVVGGGMQLNRAVELLLELLGWGDVDGVLWM